MIREKYPLKTNAVCSLFKKVRNELIEDTRDCSSYWSWHREDLENIWSIMKKIFVCSSVSTEIQRCKMKLHCAFIDGDQLRIEVRRFFQNWNRLNLRLMWIDLRRGNNSSSWWWRWITICFTIFASDRRWGWKAHTFMNQTHDTETIIISWSNACWKSTMINFMIDFQG